VREGISDHVLCGGKILTDNIFKNEQYDLYDKWLDIPCSELLNTNGAGNTFSSCCS
jgi:hypothetical protein